jgi:hypothetical protein
MNGVTAKQAAKVVSKVGTENGATDEYQGAAVSVSNPGKSVLASVTTPATDDSARMGATATGTTPVAKNQASKKPQMLYGTHKPGPPPGPPPPPPPPICIAKNSQARFCWPAPKTTTSWAVLVQVLLLCIVGLLMVTYPSSLTLAKGNNTRFHNACVTDAITAAAQDPLEEDQLGLMKWTQTPLSVNTMTNTSTNTNKKPAGVIMTQLG